MPIWLNSLVAQKLEIQRQHSPQFCQTSGGESTDSSHDSVFEYEDGDFNFTMGIILPYWLGSGVWGRRQNFSPVLTLHFVACEDHDKITQEIHHSYSILQ
jgi:hypothetical protein